MKAMVYFISFILVGSMINLNLFIGVTLQSMEEAHLEVSDYNRRKLAQETHQEGPTIESIMSQLDSLKEQLRQIKEDEKEAAKNKEKQVR